MRHIQRLLSIYKSSQFQLTNEKLKTLKIVDTTLREGQQFSTCEFSFYDQLYLAQKLCDFGVDYVEYLNPGISDKVFENCKQLCKQLNKKNTKLLAHVRCHIDDINKALQCDFDGLNLYMATSPILAKCSHKKRIDEISSTANNLITYIKKTKPELEIRFSCEDSFRSNLDEIIAVYKNAISAGAIRIGIADTIGVADYNMIKTVVNKVKRSISPNIGIEFHGHNDTGGATTNAYSAFLNGANYIDTTILGIGERNGITPLGSFLARVYSLNNEIKNKYRLIEICHLEKFVARNCDLDIPFNNPLTGSAFTHKAGVHTKAVLENPIAYEILDPETFGMSRNLNITSKLTGWNAINNRVVELGYIFNKEIIQKITKIVKNISNIKPISIEELDSIIKSFNENTDYIQVSNTKINLPKVILLFEGHLFDKNVINRILDICTHYKCIFNILEMDVPNNDAFYSTVKLSIESNELVVIVNDINNVIESMKDIANCTIKNITT